MPFLRSLIGIGASLRLISSRKLLMAGGKEKGKVEKASTQDQLGPESPFLALFLPFLSFFYYLGFLLEDN